MRKVSLSLVMMMVFVLMSVAYAQSISITIDPSSITEVKNREFFTKVSYDITGTFDSCYLKVDESSLPPEWQLKEKNPKEIDCSSGTTNLPKILATSTDSNVPITIIVKGEGTPSKQDTETLYVTVEEGAILDARLIPLASSITVEKGKTYKIEFNVENIGDVDSESAAASINCPSGYSCPPTLTLKGAGQSEGVITAGNSIYGSFDVKASDNPTSRNLEIIVSAANSQVSDTIRVPLSYSAPDGGDGEGTHPSPTGPSIPPQKLKNATKKLELVPGVGLRNNTKLQAAIEKVLAKGKMSEQARENMLRLSKSITSDLEVERKFEAKENKSTLKTKIRYKGNKTAKNFIVYDSVPKRFANSSDLIKVTAAGATVEVVEPDPEYLFNYPEVSTDQDLEIIYEVSGEKDASLINETSVEFYAESLEEVVPEEEKVCTQGEKRCLDNKLQECKDNTWTTIETCEYGCNSTSLTCNLEPEVEKPEEKPLNWTPIIIIIVVIALAGLGYYFGVYKKKKLEV